MTGSVSGYGQRIHGLNPVAPSGNQAVNGENKHQLYGETGLHDSNYLPPHERGIAMSSNPANEKGAAPQRISEEFRRLANRSRDGIYRYDLTTHRFLFINNMFLEYYGIDAEGGREVTAKSVLNSFCPEDLDKVKKARDESLAPGSTGGEAEYRQIRPDGSLHWMHDRWIIITDETGKPVTIEGIVRDNTERKQAENALRESEERLRFHTDNSPMAMVEWNTDFIVTRWTGAAEKMFGWSAEETIGKPIMELRMIYEEDIPIVQSVMQRLTDGKSKHVVSSNRNYTKKGQVIHCEWYNSVLHDSVGKMISVMSQVLDITGRKLAEIRLARLNNCFLQFGVSPDDNINRLVAVCGELMNATCALYNRLEKNLLCSVGQWRTPAGFKPKDKPNGHICYDVIQHGGEHPLLVRNLQESPYARTDPNVLLYGLQTYLGMVVKWQQAAVGSLCVVYQADMTPSNDDLQLMTIIASAIAVEEDRRRVEEALRRAEENFQRSLDDSPLGARVVTLDGETIYVNQAILDIYGYDSIEELNTIPIKKRYTPESYAEFQIRREKRKRGDYASSEYEVSIVKKDGEVRHLHVFRKQILWDGERQFQVLYNDITDRKRVEEALRASEDRYRDLVENSQDLICTHDLKGNLLSVNEAASELTGYSRERLLQMNMSELLAPEVRERFDAYLTEIKMKGQANGILKIQTAAGEIRYWEYHNTLRTGPDAPIVRGMAYDITKRMQAEKELRASREQMRALAGRLQAVREEERTQIAREIHDELGGALTGLKIDFSFLTRAALKMKNETERTPLLAGMDSMIKSIDATIHTVRRIAMELRPGVLDDLGLVAALEWQLKDFEKRTGIRCEFFPPMEEISLDADLSTALFRIFQEALTNVARHSGATEVRVRLRADADSATLEVEDNGKGIEQEKALSSKSLGLLGMRERAQMFGGRIAVAGTSGIGTKVTVEIPPVEKRKMDRDQEGAAE